MLKNNKSNPISKNFMITGLLVVLLVGASFTIGILWTKVQQTQSGNVAGTGTPTPSPTAAQPNTPEPTAGTELPPISDADHIRGNKNAKIAIIEYSDLECPYCKNFHPTAQQAVDEYDGQVMWVYRHFPLDQIHPKARKEAEAVECAAKLGGNDSFWTMLDAIYEASPNIILSDLPTIAGQVGLDINAFTQCLDSGEMANIVQEHYTGGVAAGVRGTPGNFIVNTENGNSTELSGAQPYSRLKSVIDQMLQ